MNGRQLSVIVGSLKRDSINRRLAHALVKLAPAGFSFDFPDIGLLPHYNEDLEADVPAEAQHFRDRLRPAEGVIFAVPEYNRGIPGVVKNALDWGSRPKTDSVWTGKPALITGTSRGAISTAAMQVHLRAVLGSMGMYPLGNPEAYIQYHDGLIDDDGSVTVRSTEQFLELVLTAFVELLDRFR